MPQYNSPMVPPQLLMKGVPAYLFGSLNMLRGNASGTVSQTALAANVATVTVQINQGPIPLVGDLITVWGTTQQTGLFNVTRAIITGVTITATTGAGTITYALTGSNQSATADTGSFMTEPAASAESLANGYSMPICIQAPSGDSQFTITAEVTFPTLPTAVTVTLQEAVRDVSAEYADIGTVSTVAGSAVTVGPLARFTMERGNFYRFHVSGLSGTGTIVAKLI